MKRTALVASALCFALASFGSFAEDKMDKMEKTDKMEKSDKMAKKDRMAKKDKMDKMDKMEKPGTTQ